MFYAGELYNISTNDRGNHVLYKQKNMNGFKVKITFSNDKADNEEAFNALKDFYINN